MQHILHSMLQSHSLGPVREDCKIHHRATGYFMIYRSYGDAVRELDSGVGVILDTLQTLDIDKDTLVMFSSDNGGATYAGVNGITTPNWLLLLP